MKLKLVNVGRRRSKSLARRDPSVSYKWDCMLTIERLDSWEHHIPDLELLGHIAEITNKKCVIAALKPSNKYSLDNTLTIQELLYKTLQNTMHGGEMKHRPYTR